MLSPLRRSNNRPLESPLAFSCSTPISPEEKKASSAPLTGGCLCSLRVDFLQAYGGRTMTCGGARARRG
ncbi:hypothetical protein ES332_D13G143400v1 [Gossypium tomentosum]|uniref:Uncharacterized protein n=1 Tax=Gossypium tomentosum TaxID=34277 RepID=A0A5D2HX15_GOSTO|nr:hypothetical protein ES332_D13G143400v1 [Gossypium tomentosum]